jgi:phosphoribosylanthranilate isomerase
MALKTFVKINRITNLTDARFCAGMNVDVMGFSLESDEPNFLTPTQFKEITGWISGIEFAAEFKNASSDEIKGILENYSNITWIESQNLETLLGLGETGMQLIYKQKIDDEGTWQENTLKKLKGLEISVHLISQTETFTQKKLDLIDSISSYCKVILGFGITPETAENILSTHAISGFALDSGDEIKPGLRDFDKLADILEILEVEE